MKSASLALCLTLTLLLVSTTPAFGRYYRRSRSGAGASSLQSDAGAAAALQLLDDLSPPSVSMYRTRKSEGESIGCKSVPSMKSYKFLNKICDDCFQLYRDAEVYALCR